MNLAKPGSLVIVLGVASCADCGQELPDGEGVAGEIVGGWQGVSCFPCASEGTSAHLFADVPGDYADEPDAA